MHPPGADVVVVSHGDIGVKSATVQRSMERRLVANLEATLDARGVDAEVEDRWTRPLIHVSEPEIEAATAAACDTFGVRSASPAVSVPPTLDAMREALAETGRAVYTDGSFAVRARRAGERDSHPFTSEELEREGGRAVWEAVSEGFEPTVDLEDPDLTFSVECREREAFVACERREGPGGLPLGSQGRLVALVSGGIDSPVAAWSAMRRGCSIVPLYVDLGEFGGVDHVARAEAAIGVLEDYAAGFDMRPRIVPGGEAAELIAREVRDERMLVLRRFMLRVAERVAEEEDACGIVTGEALGQKSSQTAVNLSVTDRAVDVPVHRPLLAYDKHEIEARAREIGTYEEATIPAGCNRMAPDHPETQATLAGVERVEPDLEGLIEEAVAGIEVVER
ncbi:tRNA sulfurtransferase [Natronorarus salvus]|uniref:tRNA sulfurtransferase n=1 Tax=Natronorarus salvus TaxID=3117733 RepID=UPI002F25FB8F